MIRVSIEDARIRKIEFARQWPMLATASFSSQML